MLDIFQVRHLSKFSGGGLFFSGQDHSTCRHTQEPGPGVTAPSCNTHQQELRLQVGHASLG